MNLLPPTFDNVTRAIVATPLRRSNALLTRALQGAGGVRYGLVMTAVAAGLGAVLAACGAAAGLSYQALATGTTEVVIGHMALLTVLLWPSMAMLVRGQQRRTPGAWLGVALYPLALIAFMAAYFGKPFDLAVAGPSGKLAAAALAMLMGSWLIVEAARQARDDLAA
ncbi:MAG: hypothetical protein GC150_04550 [Rhizobiales bacterium]|nr:hypothetical protein [Hyphomicrobiales bacterium]